jgi:transposase
VMVAAQVDPERLVFVDEMGIHTSLAPLYGYSPKGERVRLEVPRNRAKNTTLLASITPSGMGEMMAVEGSTDREVFEAYVEHALAPTLEAGQIVIMDNLPAHKPTRVRELIEERGCELIYLPAYSPDFNPTLKKRLPSSRRCCARLRGAPEKPCWKQWVERLML